MFCNKCGNKLDDNARFCNKCGNNLGVQTSNNYEIPGQIYPNYQVNYQQPTYNVQPNNNRNPKKNGKTAGLTAAIVVLAVAIVLILKFGFGGEGVKVTPDPQKNRTIMIYMTGSDLESEGAFASFSIKSILEANVNLEDTNVVLMLGGSKNWHNEYTTLNNVVLLNLTKEGFVTDKSYGRRNMGDASLLNDFLNYTYKNYKAQKYDLILWNHGSGIRGTNIDEWTSDNINMLELKDALKTSPFNSNNKFEFVTLIACLMGNYEYATILKDYTDYLTVTEEAAYAGVVKEINQIVSADKSDSPYSINKRFIDSWFNELNQNYLPAQSRTQTYAILDLTKMNTLVSNLETFFGDIDLTKDYSTVARVRSSLTAYGMEDSNAFSLVDLYTLINGLKSLSPTKANELLQNLKSLVIYNKSNNNYSNGLSILFPYNNHAQYPNYNADSIKYRAQEFKNSNYQKFLTDFYNMKNGGNKLSWSFENVKKGQTSSIKANTEFGFYLTNEEKELYTNSVYRIFKKVNGNYMPVYSSSNVEFDEETGYVKINYNNKGLKINGEIKSIYLEEISRDSELVEYLIPVKLYKDDENSVDANLIYAIDLKDGTGYIESIKLKSDESENEVIPSMMLLDLKNYKTIEFNNNSYKISDDNKKYNVNWKKQEEEKITANLENFNLELADLSDNDNYVAVLEVYDVYGNGHYTNLLKIEN